MDILITGGLGFIGSALVRKMIKGQYGKVVVLDKLTYASDARRLKEVEGQYKFYKGDICDREFVGGVIKKEGIDCIINFAAETHVDRSIKNNTPFIWANVIGTQILLELSREYGIERFIQISTDEVYGEIIQGSFSEDSKVMPNSPYSASKASADLLIRAYIRTYRLPAIIIRPSNNYGPWQYPEKFIPLAILKILKNERIPLYGDGTNVREWLYVEDCVDGVIQIFERGRLGEIYNLGSGEEMRNIDIAKIILDELNKPEDFIEFVKDRPGHDKRYSLDSKKVYEAIRWKPKVGLKEGIAKTVRWYIEHKDWMFEKWEEVVRFYRDYL